MTTEIDALNRAPARPASPGGEPNPHESAGILPIMALVLGVIAYDAVINALFFHHNGWLAAHGPDIWYFLAVAQGKQPLGWLDATTWIVKPAGWFSPAGGFAALLVLSTALHALSACLVYRFLPRFIDLGEGPRWAAAATFALLPHNTIVATAAFTHFTVAQPLLILACGLLLPWCLGSQPRPDLWGLVCLAETMVIGPEGFFLLAALAAVAASTRLDFAGRLARLKCPPLAAIGIGCILLTVLFPVLFKTWNYFSLHLRGIDLLWQKSIRSGDLMPMGWRLFTSSLGFQCVWIAAAAFAVWKKKWLLAALLLGALTLTVLVTRGYLALEMIGFACLIALLGGPELSRSQKIRILIVLPVWLLLFGLLPKQTRIPSSMVRLAQAIRTHSTGADVIACSPTYGFFLQAWTGLDTTDDLHREAGIWADLAATTPLEAARTMEDHGIVFFVLTSYDFSPGAQGDWLSGGLQNTLAGLNDESYRLSLAVRTLGMNPPMIRPMRVLIDHADPVSRQRNVCLTR